MDSLKEQAPHGFVSLRDYVDTRFEASNLAVNSALIAAEKAVGKAETAMEKRFDNTNEWRTTVETLQRNYPTRTEQGQEFSSVNAKIEVLQKFLWVGLGIVLAFNLFAAIVVTIVLFLAHK